MKEIGRYAQDNIQTGTTIAIHNDKNPRLALSSDFIKKQAFSSNLEKVM